MGERRMSNIWTPNTDEVRGTWIAMTHAPEAFDRWIEQIRASERQRAIDILDQETVHYGKTHSAKTACRTCDIMLAIQGEKQ
ncbi:monooxygenase [Aurantimicrobium minutum]|uniref:Monooxygenase n=2 Tax=Aurantimicrobium minutum TaxID=708131 RepID=A0A173LXN9_9MICO|nr:monooxygenase [Aurantimicrobium minutum]